MKFLKKFLLVLFSLIAIITTSIFGYLQYSKPNYEGQITIKNISKTTNVYFDEYGIPHIYAETQKDAMTVLGYVHAQERLWQMELLRRIAPGRLSEIFGTKALKNDLFFAGIGIDEKSEIAIAALDKNSETYKMSMAYLDGVNQYLDNGKTPIEFTILGIKKEKFTLKDVYNTFGYMAFSFAMAHKTDPLLTTIRDKFGAEYLKDLGINSDFNFTKIKNFEGQSKAYSEISKSVTSLLDNSPIPPFIGSNSWVLGPEKTKNKKVIFENDPHIGFSQPCTWFEARISTPDFENYGYYLAGTPFPLLGHNRVYAYGLTMFENDDLDLFQEEVNSNNPNEYKTSNGYKAFTTRTKNIKVKDSASVNLTIKETENGPLVNGLLTTLSDKNPVSMSWIYTQQKNRSIEAVYKLSHAKNVDDFYKNIELISSPGLNIMYGDALGNIAWITSGKLYKKDKSINSNFILDGTNLSETKKEFLDFSKNPHAINPPWNYVASANNQPEAINNYLYPGYYLPENRAKRIQSLLAPKNDWTLDEVAKMSLDDTAIVEKELVVKWLKLVDKNLKSGINLESIIILENWNGATNTSEIAPTIYNKWVYFYLKNTFEDEMGANDFNNFLSTHVMKQVIANQSQNATSVWWDNLATKNKKETQQEIINLSFRQTILSLEKQLGKNISNWKWGKVHTLEHKHPLGQVAILSKLFNVGTFEVSGSNEVINNMIFSYSDAEKSTVNAGPSTRRIIDFSDIENSVSILPTGNSGNPMSKHYNDQAEMYNLGKFRKMKMNKKEIMETSTKLVFVPKK
jgi:penicillin G amidase